ncbi:MAG TPA: type II toxin-antitoxin system RelE/ParE family toxin [Burkholderiales bacterium]|nr:type II toxin-antitoxin system RelE/ParE family toxin [Burkholderiales bacterium]
MTYSLHSEASKELAEAAEFYRERGGIALARAFLNEFERVISLLERYPELGTPASGGLRIQPLRRFPYSMVYRPAREGLQILVIGHQHRRPHYWKGRV